MATSGTLFNSTFSTYLPRTSIPNAPSSIPYLLHCDGEKETNHAADRYMVKEQLKKNA